MPSPLVVLYLAARKRSALFRVFELIEHVASVLARTHMCMEIDMIARKVGVSLGKVAGWTAATAWKGVVIGAHAAGEAGEGFMEGSQVAWEGRNEELDRKIAAHKAKIAAQKAERLAATAQPTPTIAVSA